MRSNDERIMELCGMFHSRIEQYIIDDVLIYLQHGEEWLALEMLCEKLIEHNVPILADEYNKAVTIAKSMNIDTNSDLTFVSMSRLLNSMK